MEKHFVLRYLSRVTFLAALSLALLYAVVNNTAAQCIECTADKQNALSTFIFWLGSQISESNPSHFSFESLQEVTRFLLSTLILTIAAALLSRPLARKLYLNHGNSHQRILYLVSIAPLILWIAVLHNIDLNQWVSGRSYSVFTYALIFAFSLVQWTKIGLNKRLDSASFLFNLPASYAINISGLFLIQFLLTHDSLGGQILEKIATRQFSATIAILTAVILAIISFQDICEYLANKAFTKESKV